MACGGPAGPGAAPAPGSRPPAVRGDRSRRAPLLARDSSGAMRGDAGRPRLGAPGQQLEDEPPRGWERPSRAGHSPPPPGRAGAPCLLQIFTACLGLASLPELQRSGRAFLWLFARRVVSESQRELLPRAGARRTHGA